MQLRANTHEQGNGLYQVTEAKEILSMTRSCIMTALYLRKQSVHTGRTEVYLPEKTELIDQRMSLTY